MDHERYSFWKSPDLWPRDDSARGLVFLARAYDEVGRAAFGSDWEFADPPTEPGASVAVFPSAVDAPEGTDEERRERQKAWRAAQDRGGAAPSFGPEWLARGVENSDRRLLVKQRVMNALGGGELEYRLRPQIGGAYSNIHDPTLWVSEHRTLDARFRFCRMSADEPFRPCNSTTGDWIFVTHESLDRYLSKMSSSIHEGDRQPKKPNASGRSGYAEYVKSTVLASPSARSVKKADMIDVGTNKFFLSKRQSQAVRDSTLTEIGGDVEKAWRKKGRS